MTWKRVNVAPEYSSLGWADVCIDGEMCHQACPWLESKHCTLWGHALDLRAGECLRCQECAKATTHGRSPK